MKTILIVEDNEIMQLWLEKTLLSIDTNLKILKTPYAKEALEYAQNNMIHAFLLDIKLLDYSGLTLGAQIREIPDYFFSPIIFVTGLVTKQLIAFKELHSYDYLVKPFSEEDFISTMEPIINFYESTIETNQAQIQLKRKEIIYNFNQNDILYMEYRNRKLHLTTLQDNFSFPGYTLKSTLEYLEGNFRQCHKSYILNVKYIKKIDKKEFLIYLYPEKKSIPLGRKYLQDLINAWLFE